MDVQIGVLPADVLDAIVQYSEPQSAVAIYLSCKYWHNRFKTIFAADRVVVSARIKDFETNFRYIFELYRGRVKEYKLDHDQNDLDGYACIPVNRVAIGYFNTVADTTKFIKQINDILINNKDVADIEVNPFFECSVELGSAANNKVYYTVDHGDQGILIDAHKGTQILELIKQAGFVPRSVVDNASLKIKTMHRNSDRKLIYKSKVHINPQGDVFMKINSNVGSEEITLRTSSELYDQIIEIIKYSKHKTNTLTSKQIEKDDIQSLFCAKLKCDETKYIVQEYNVYESPSIITNGYKTHAAKRIVKLLLTHLYPTKLDENSSVRSERELPKPQALIYDLARRVPYPMSIDRFLRIDNLSVSINHGGETSYIDLGLRRHLNIPRKELIDLLQLLEAQPIQRRGNRLQYRMDKHIKGEGSIIMQVYIDTFYNHTYLTPKLEKVIVDRLWTLLRTSGYLDFLNK